MKTIQETIDNLNSIHKQLNVNEFIEKYSYLTNITRESYIPYATLINAYETKSFGKLFRKVDPIAFNKLRTQNNETITHRDRIRSRTKRNDTQR